MRIILTGIAGRLGRRVAQRLAQHHEVIGIDRRPALGLPEGVVSHRCDLRRRSAEEVFRKSHADVVVHMGVVHNFRISSERLYARNVIATETLLQYVSRYRVGKMVLLSSGDVYGPSPGNSHFIDEDAPLMASQRFPEIRTVVAVDRLVQSFFWRHHDVETVILRPCHIIGANVRNAPANYLRLRVIPTILGFDPILQLLHEDDLLRMVEAAVAPGRRGVFNLAGTPPLPLSRILRELGKPTVPVPYALFRAFLARAWRLRLVSFPAPELDHIRFNAVLDTRRAEAELAVTPEVRLAEMLEPFRASAELLR